MTEGHQVRHSQLPSRAVVARNERRLHPVGEPIDHDHRQFAGHQLPVALGISSGVRVQAGDEDDAAHLAVEEHVDVLILGHAARRLRAQHRRVSLLREHRLNDLRKRRKDRVV